VDTTQVVEDGAASVTRFRVRKRIVIGNTSELLPSGASAAACAARSGS
jgi:hypothetical protein